ncbi:MAG TPA: acetate--CoA ligase family protein [Thermomicrobiaceae bacterium]|nr:acetate--CoA ligase family protein [Thermomicrobiaceae bacterium]
MANEPMPAAPVGAADWTGTDGDDSAAHPLYPIFYPRSVAVVGASPRGGYGLGVISALRSFGYAGTIYPVNPNHATIADLPAYPELGAIPEPVDAVAIAVPARAVPGVVRQAIATGARGGVAFGSGFAEAGEDGQALQAELRDLCGDRFPLVGPNCLGVVNYRGAVALWAITTGSRRRAGSVGLVAQSGNMALTLMASSRGLELAHAVSAGNQAAVDVVDVMSFSLAEPGVRAIAAVIEGLADVAKFRRVAARAAARDVPIIALKLGRSEKAGRAALAHTGSLTGADQLYDALFEQEGVIRVDDLEELMETAKVLSADRRPAGTGLGIFASSGGECGLVSDLAAASGVDLPDLLPDTREALRELLPPFANPLNPLDITASGWGSRAVFGGVASLLAETPGVDLVACVGDMTRSSGSLEHTGWDQMIAGMADARARTDKPVAVINTITDVAHEATDAMAEQGLIHLSGARTALRAIGHAGRYGRWRAAGRGARRDEPEVDDERRAAALALLPAAGSGGASESAGKELLRRYGIPVPAGGLAGGVDEALALARAVGYPVALKVEADGVAHKTEVGGVALGIASDERLRAEHAALLARIAPRLPDGALRGVRVERMASGLVELIVGGRNDPVFGPVVVAGLGGVLAEALGDVATRLAPVDAAEARRMLGGLRGAALLGPFRGRPAVDVAAAAEVIARVSRLLVELPEVRELDLNPVLVGAVGEGCVALDALAVV